LPHPLLFKSDDLHPVFFSKTGGGRMIQRAALIPQAGFSRSVHCAAAHLYHFSKQVLLFKTLRNFLQLK